MIKADAVTHKYSLPDFLFHGTTTSRVASILREGLTPQACQDDVKRDSSAEPRLGVYLTSDWQLAADFALLAVDRWGGEIVVFAIPSLVLDQTKLESDDYDLADALRDLADPESLHECGSTTESISKFDLTHYKSWRDVPWEVSLCSVNQVLYTSAIPQDALSVVEQDRHRAVILPLLKSKIGQGPFTDLRRRPNHPANR